MARSRSDPAERRARHAAVDDPGVVMEAAATFLGVRPRSVHETRRRLIHHGYREELVEGVLERLVEMGYLDDEGFARAWIESRDRSRPRGEDALRRELSLKGIDRDTIVAALADRAREPPADDGAESAAAEPTSADRAAAERLLERRRETLLRDADPRKRQQRAYALLARNGFDPQTCQEVSARLLK
ncbi:MAG: RecX family transcriptional regulator [Chloroflexota bacterium]|nr:RecX family transcriptional regulator [Chloroflexota bacterium]